MKGTNGASIRPDLASWGSLKTKKWACPIFIYISILGWQPKPDLNIKNNSHSNIALVYY